MRIDRLPLLQFFAFLPWAFFWNQRIDQLQDGRRLLFAFERDCRKVSKKTSKIFQVEVVHSERAREQGLSDRREPLKPTEGMAFVYDREVQLEFWMLRTYIPLQLIYVDAKGVPFQTLEMPVDPDPFHPKIIYRANKPGNLALELAPQAVKSLKGKQVCVSFNL